MMQFSSFRKSILTVTITVLEVVKLRLKRKITFQFFSICHPIPKTFSIENSKKKAILHKKVDIQNRMIETVINNRCYLHAP